MSLATLLAGLGLPQVLDLQELGLLYVLLLSALAIAHLEAHVYCLVTKAGLNSEYFP